MHIIKRYLFCAAALLSIVLFSVKALAETRISGLLFSKEARYVEALQGFKDMLKKAGYEEPNTTFKIENAEGNKAKAAELVQKLSEEKPDLIVTLGTSSTVATSRVIKDVPIVFSVVYDPVVAGIAKTWESSGNNTTGTSSQISMSKLMDILNHFTSVKKLAVLYTPGEKNSEASLKDLQKVEASYEIKVIPVRLTSIEEIHQLLPEVLRATDAIYVTGSNLVDSQVAIISDMATKAKIPTITHLEDLVEKGVLMGVCADSYDMGQDAGAKAVEILKGAKPSSLPIDFPKKFNVILNIKTAQKGQLQIPVEFMKTITKKIE